MDGIVYRPDETTGELMADNVNLNKKIIVDKETRQRQIDGKNQHEENQKIKKLRGPNYTNCFVERWPELNSNAGPELGALFPLLLYMQLDKDELLIKGGNPARIADIADMIGRGERQTKEAIKRLREIDVIIKEGSGPRNTQYRINSKYAIMGTFPQERKDQMYIRLYHKEARDKLKQITLEDANILTRIIPLFHYSEYVLCGNPTEPNRELVSPLTMAELAEIISIKRPTLISHIGNLVKAGYILRLTGIGNASIFKVNPDIFSRENTLNSETAQALRADFNRVASIHERESKAAELGIDTLAD
ncbi:hypothetical protein [Paenibacillus rhizophilus]|uniref:Helix-turn-helix domain-containing protein n=1 Tax=Paenibacillus rhizophilus TaxID=1850366 RepID=A0A3N9PTZ6_9BACL|nr:hypothetical protein [Paenibacillus rhizophilus]RQW08716.1 hypothetical protein EH198_21425 [Paenibacillus rhizophilus]